MSGQPLLLHHLDRGRGEPVLFLHGLLGTGRYHWRDQYRPVAGRYRVVLPDLRGHGLTPLGDGFAHAPARVAADVLHLLDHLAIPRAHVVGLSLGAYAGLHLAVHHRDRLLSLTLSGVVHDMDPIVVNRLAEQLEIFRQLRDDPRMNGLRRRHKHLHWFDLAEAVHQDLLREPVRWPAEVLAELETPVLLLQGDRIGEEVDSAVLMREAIPGAELCILPGAGHTCQWERPRLYTAALLEFLERNSGLSRPEH